MSTSSFQRRDLVLDQQFWCSWFDMLSVSYQLLIYTNPSQNISSEISHCVQEIFMFDELILDQNIQTRTGHKDIFGLHLELLYDRNFLFLRINRCTLNSLPSVSTHRSVKESSCCCSNIFQHRSFWWVLFWLIAISRCGERYWCIVCTFPTSNYQLPFIINHDMSHCHRIISVSGSKCVELKGKLLLQGSGTTCETGWLDVEWCVPR